MAGSGAKTIGEYPADLPEERRRRVPAVRDPVDRPLPGAIAALAASAPAGAPVAQYDASRARK